MRILMISPHPTFSPRGTPISVLNRCRALCALGHEIDLVTYGIGIDVPVTGLTWLRAPVPGIRKVGVGPSLRKVPLDLAVFVKATVQAVRHRRDYDVIHSHEEAGMLGAVLSRLLRIPHVYDMGNDLSVVMQNYGFSATHLLTRVAVAAETMTVRGADSVIAHFPSISSRVAAVSAGEVPSTVVANVPIETPALPELAAQLRAKWSPAGLPIVLYTGTLERYQGLAALVEAAGILQAAGVPCRVIVVGGTSEQQSDLRRDAEGYSAAEVVDVVGAVSQDHIGSCLAAADVLVSPRAGGSNTPLKIFSYMHSGKPLLATRIDSHLQVLSDDSALLVEPTAEAIAGGLREIFHDPAAAADRATAAKRLAAQRYSITHYLSEVADAYLPVGGAAASSAGLTQADHCLRADLIRAAG